MSKAYEMIMESLTEIVTDIENNDGQNLKREKISVEVVEPTLNKQVKKSEASGLISKRRLSIQS